MSTRANAADELIQQALDRGQTALSEHDAKRLLAAYEIPIPQENLAVDASAAVRAADAIGYPVAVKACAPTLLHKSDAGLVALNVGDPAGVEAAVAAIDAAVGNTPLDGYLVQAMVYGKREVIVGGMRDALFGPCVMFGLGGILVEAIADVVFRLAPLDQRDALEMVAEVRAHHVFDAIRGEPAVDRPALAGLLMAVGRLLEEQPRVAQVDINPVIVSDARPVAVDALVTFDAA